MLIEVSMVVAFEMTEILSVDVESVERELASVYGCWAAVGHTGLVAWQKIWRCANHVSVNQLLRVLLRLLVLSK